MKSIGDAAAAAGVAPHVLRHWESAGLLSPARTAGDQRLYGDDDLHRIALIRRAKDAGLQLADIRVLLTGDDRAGVLDRHRAELTARIARDRAALEMLEHAARCPHPDLVRCPDLRRALLRAG